MTNMAELNINQVKVGERMRMQIGDLDSLKASMRELGMLQPLVLDGDYNLIAGFRRHQAAIELGWEHVPVFVAMDTPSALVRLKAERDENTCRKEFTPSEAVAMGKAIEALLKPAAKARQSAAGPKNGKGKKSASGSGNLPEPVKGQTRDQVAAAVGMSGKTYETAKKVVAAAQEKPELKPVVQEMDRTGNVTKAARKAGVLSAKAKARIEAAAADRWAKVVQKQAKQESPGSVSYEVEVAIADLKLILADLEPGHEIDDQKLCDVANELVLCASRLRKLAAQAKKEGK